MSVYFRMVRERWAAREMRVTRWFKGVSDRVAADDPICEVSIDGELYTVRIPETWGAGIYAPLVEIGEEVPPGGELFEYSEHGRTAVRDPRIRRRVPRWAAFRRRDRYPQLFLSYRRDDAEAYAGRLHEALSHRFGSDDVFMDIFGVRPGEPFPWAVQQCAAHCDVMVILIGPKWLDVTDRWGKRRRLDDESDYVRREITAALDRRVLVTPVVLSGTPVPDADKLPQELRGLEQMQMLELGQRYWRAAVDELIVSIERELSRLLEQRR